MSDQNLVEEIARLRAENAKLKEKQNEKAAKKRSKNGLRNIPNYDPALFFSPDEIAQALFDKGMAKSNDKTEAYPLINLMRLTPYAQSKEPGAKGIGKRLFLRGDVEDAINHLTSWPGFPKGE